jgi:MFS family permease
MIHRLRRLPLWQPLAVRNFWLLWIGQSVSILGDQFYFIGLMWLTLQVTKSGLTVGTVLMTTAVARVIFMLVGGAISDRFSPRQIMLVSNAIRAVLVAVITKLILLDVIKLWHLYLLGVTFGLAEAFFQPAYMTIVPMLVDNNRLKAANALLQGTNQFCGLVGSALGGLLVSAVGLEVAFGLDAASFVFAAVTLWLIQGSKWRKARQSWVSTQAPPAPQEEGIAKTGFPSLNSVVSSIWKAIRYAWSDPLLRTIQLIFAGINFLLVGPLAVGTASLASNRFAGSAIVYGAMLSAWGGGALLGALVAGLTSRLRHRGIILLGVAGVLGIGLILLGFVPNAVLASVVISFMGLGSGFINVIGRTWLQTRSDPQLLGRVMSLGMFFSDGLRPFSYVLAGALIDLDVTIMFVAAGAILLIVAGLSAANRTVRTID